MFKPPKQRGNKDLTNCVMLVTKLEKVTWESKFNKLQSVTSSQFSLPTFPEKGHFVGTLGFATYRCGLGVQRIINFGMPKTTGATHCPHICQNAWQVATSQRFSLSSDKGIIVFRRPTVWIYVRKGCYNVKPYRQSKLETALLSAFEAWPFPSSHQRWASTALHGNAYPPRNLWSG